MNNPSITNLQLLLSETQMIQTFCEHIVDALTGPHDLTPEQLEYWRTRGILLTDALKALCHSGKELAAQLSESENKILTIPLETDTIQ